jgi:hypothetical protein
LKKAPCLEHVLDPVPDLVIIELGSNQLWATREELKLHVKEFLSALSQIKKCVWIAPPSMRSFSAEKIQMFHEVLLEVADRCTVFKSDHPDVTRYDLVWGDGIHYWNFDEAAKWARAAYDCIIGNGNSNSCRVP